MIVVAVIALLSSLAIPQYQTYAKRTKFTEIILQISPIKNAINVCYQTRGQSQLSNCDTEAELGISFETISLNPKVSSITITPNTAEVTITATSELDSETYILTPVPTANSLNWSQSGSCISAGIC